MESKILFVGGSWDLNGGRESGFIKKFYLELLTYNNNITYLNGGNYNDLQTILNSVEDYDVICWFANVDNSLPKVRSVKKINPYTILIGSKRNDNNKYSFVEVLNRTLMERHNLSIEFSKQKEIYKMLLFDPLGSKWYEGTSISDLVQNLYKRLLFISNAKREHTYNIEGQIEIPNNEEFFSFVRKVAETFHKTIDHSEGVTKFMGNASFRGKDNYLFVSKRDVDKSNIDKNNFVACQLNNGILYYYGDTKPSKDTISQANLYNLFPNINYMIHSHCYAIDGKYTEMPVPCGSLDEIDEITKVIDNQYGGNYGLSLYKINYLGHGCLLLGKSVDDLKTTNFIPRIFPEELPNVDEILNNGVNRIKNNEDVKKVLKKN
jgi:hypothetical protein